MYARTGIVAIAALALACTRAPSDAEIEGELTRARAENEALASKAGKAESRSWTLQVRGNVRGGGVELSWDEIEKRATSHIKTTAPTHTQDVKKVLDYRGIVLRDLLGELGAYETEGPGGHDVTLVAADGFRNSATMGLIQRTPIMLAVEEDGAPLVRKTGGPLLEVMPHTTHPESFTAFPEGGAYYVTIVIVGTERLALDVLGKRLDARDLEGMSQKTVTGKVGYRSRWSSTGISLHGPLLRDVIEVGAKTKIEAGSSVKIERKPHSDIPHRSSMTLPAEDVLRCDIIVATRVGDNRELIPAVQGGPAVLAFPKACAESTKNQPWPNYVEKISIVPAEDAGASAPGGSPDAGKDGR